MRRLGYAHGCAYGFTAAGCGVGESAQVRIPPGWLGCPVWLGDALLMANENTYDRRFRDRRTRPSSRSWRSHDCTLPHGIRHIEKHRRDVPERDPARYCRSGFPCRERRCTNIEAMRKSEPIMLNMPGAMPGPAAGFCMPSTRKMHANAIFTAAIENNAKRRRRIAMVDLRLANVRLCIQRIMRIYAALPGSRNKRTS